MTNTKLLMDKIKASGLKMFYIAQFVGLSRAGLYNKINNKRPFNQYEIEKLCVLLKITSLKEKNAIFFANYVI